MSDGQRVVVLDPAELEAIVERAVRRALKSKRADAGDEAWLDAEGAAEILGVCARQVQRLAKAGALPHRRLGKLYRFKREDVLAFLERGSP